MNPVLMHINYGEMGFNSFGTRSVDDICRMAAEIGFDGVEFRSDPPKEMKDMSIEEYYAQIAAGKKGLPVDGSTSRSSAFSTALRLMPERLAVSADSYSCLPALVVKIRMASRKDISSSVLLSRRIPASNICKNR